LLLSVTSVATGLVTATESVEASEAAASITDGIAASALSECAETFDASTVESSDLCGVSATEATDG
jgi:hypothetical protein